VIVVLQDVRLLARDTLRELRDQPVGQRQTTRGPKTATQFDGLHFTVFVLDANGLLIQSHHLTVSPCRGGKQVIGPVCQDPFVTCTQTGDLIALGSDTVRLLDVDEVTLVQSRRYPRPGVRRHLPWISPRVRPSHLPHLYVVGSFPFRARLVPYSTSFNCLTDNHLTLHRCH